MSADFKPGAIAMVTDATGDVRPMVLISDGGDWPMCWHGANEDGRLRCLDANQAQEARPLVVIDPEDREQVARVVIAAERQGLSHRDEGVDYMQAALRSLITPPKPDEPTGLGAVVEDADGNKWVYISDMAPSYRCWRRVGYDVWCDYANIAAVKVLSEGVVQP